MEVLFVTRVPMDVKVDPVAHQPANHVQAQEEQHHAHDELETPRDILGHRGPHEQHRAAHQSQRERMAHAPGRTLQHRLCGRRLARGECRHRREVVGLERVAQPDEKSEQQYRGDGHR